MVKFMDLPAQYQSIRREMDAAIREIVESAAFIGGAKVAEFEEAFAAYQGAAHAVGVGNGTDAIEIALESLALPPGSEVVVPANSFIATSEAVTRAGHQVVFCDCEPETYTLSLEALEASVTAKTRAIIPVHLYGHPCDMDGILKMARKHDLRVIEDSAQAHGAEYRGQRVGRFGELSTFSFYPGKNLGAYGDAGAILTDDAELAERCRRIANHGRTAKYDHDMEGRNSRLDGLQAAVLSVKLRHLDRWTELRRAAAAEYHQALADLPLRLPREADWARHVYHLYVVRTAARDELRAHLKEEGIETGIHYPISLPRLEAYRGRVPAGISPVADRFAGELLSLPMGEHITPDLVARVANSVRSYPALGASAS